MVSRCDQPPVDSLLGEHGLRSLCKGVRNMPVCVEDRRMLVVFAGTQVAFGVAEGGHIKIMLQQTVGNDHIAHLQPRRQPACNAGVDDRGRVVVVDQKLCAPCRIYLSDAGFHKHHLPPAEEARMKRKPVKSRLLMLLH